MKCPNIQIIGVPEEEDKKKGNEKILEEIRAENFPKMGKEIATQVQKKKPRDVSKLTTGHSIALQREEI